MGDNVYKKLQDARLALQGMEIKESGNNKFANYTYMELGDFIPHINNLCVQFGLCGVVSFNEMATLTIVNTDNIEDKIVFTSPMSNADLKGCHAIQNLGAVQTYLRRYLWVMAFEIVEHDALDGLTGKDKPEQKKPTPPKAELSEAQTTLGMELSEFCQHDEQKMQEVLKEVSYYKTDKGEGVLKVEDLRKPNGSDKFQRWVGASLGKLRSKVKELQNA